MKAVLAVLAVSVVLVLSGSVFAEEMPMAGENMVTPIEVGNTICPVEGGKIEMGKEAKVEYNGKVYNLCCAMCKKSFLSDPEKYVASLNEKMAAEAESDESAQEGNLEGDTETGEQGIPDHEATPMPQAK